MATVAYHPSGSSATRRRAFFVHLGELLDAHLGSSADLAVLALQRVNVDVIDRLSAEGLRWDELSFIIARRTLAHRRQRHEPLTPDESDKAIRLAKLLAQARMVFGDGDKALRWMRAHQRRFSGKTPLDMASTEHGARLVEEALIQIDEGYFV
ncbi:putative toxin-antitoxin system antitoxin component (TIGR02293 family) [Cupriavidus gilardii J11]|uniref:Putative toxin-antitoxin system antitoxin component (TIGR02293 family) n=1 Tax=Cupriavidus gilardii J11 TaxID=936133 RepID=A0A562BTE3_9BURK|nr:antitoxin Xre/MbcA/ParS toxin-binding domain-containing protein [Cupriavidus gilardii]TWG88462.1 putative toxin-antitoxin system antitoxin component (TIGR02293 family) [Cupriavidus gilardii J11]